MGGVKEGVMEGVKEGVMEGVKEGVMEGVMEGVKEGGRKGERGRAGRWKGCTQHTYVVFSLNSCIRSTARLNSPPVSMATILNNNHKHTCK